LQIRRKSRIGDDRNASGRDRRLMPGLTIEREMLIEAPAEVVWRTITEPDQMSLWFADRVDLVVEPGAHGYMGFGDQGGPVEKQRYADEHQAGWGEFVDRLAGVLAERRAG
jgi:hypothetical protein